jgi:hypothetical protein
MKKFKKTKGHNNNVRTNKKERRKINMFKEKYINILAGLYITFWGTLYVTLNEIITYKTTFCQGYSLLLLLGAVVLIPLYFYHNRLDKKVDIKAFDKSLKYNSIGALIVIILTEITNNFMN